MRKLIFVVMLCALFVSLSSIIQDINSAQKVAESKIKINKEDNFYIDHVFQMKGDDSKVIAYIFQLKPKGYISISVDSDITPIISYSFRNNFVEEDININIAYQMLKKDMQLRLSGINQIPEEIKKKNSDLWKKYKNSEISYFQNEKGLIWPPSGSTSTGGWVETRWNQSPSPYWNFCPIDPDTGTRCYVGCVATAMAQIINYHKYIGGVSFNSSDSYVSYYTDTNIYIDSDHDLYDFLSFSELNPYLSTLENHYNNNQELTGEDKAAIGFACGISVNMQYSSEGSASNIHNVAIALRNKFDFDTASYYEIWNPNFYSMMIDDMKHARPLELGLASSTGGDGHAIIIDGYNSNDDTYHCNFGWGGSADGWYSLPSGLPQDLTIVSNGAMNIEGGEVPTDLYGWVNISEVSPIGTYITLEGDHYYETYVDEESGTFEIYAVFDGNYTATAILGDKFYYDQQEVYISPGSNFIQFDMINYEAITGTVTAPISPENCYIDIYQDGELKSSGVTDSEGNFSIPSVLPGDYIAFASTSGNYFDLQEVTISAENQSINFNLEEYPGNIPLSYSKDATGIWSLIPNYTISCGICLIGDGLADLEGDVISKVRFKAPIGHDDGELFAQLWKGNTLISEKEITDFSQGEWIESSFDHFLPIESGNLYYIGYKIFSANGDLIYHDDGPRVEGKGAFIKTGAWAELASSFDFNFCIEAVVISQNFGNISGDVNILGGNGNVQEVAVCTDDYKARPDSEGNYNLDVKPGTYNLNAYLSSYNSSEIIGIIVNNGDEIVDQDFNLTLVNTENSTISSLAILMENYPNPFNPETIISFSLTAKDAKNAKIEIYNMKGQKIKTFSNLQINKSSSNLQINKSSNQQIIWNGTDKNGKSVGSGIYFCKLNINGKNIAFKKMALIK